MNEKPLTQEAPAQANTQNSDSSEIEKFNNAANSWWDYEGELHTLHDINPARLAYIQQHCDLSGKKVLDVGCGGGILSEALAKAGAHVTAIDLAPDSLRVARDHAQQGKLTIDYQQCAVEELANQVPGSFDVITCMEMLEHVPDPESIINACATLLKPGGDCFFSTINRNLKSFAFAIVGAEHILGLIPKGTHEYKKLIKPSELARWCRHSSIHISDSAGMHYNPLSRRTTVNKNVSVNYMLYGKKN